MWLLLVVRFDNSRKTYAQHTMKFPAYNHKQVKATCAPTVHSQLHIRKQIARPIYLFFAQLNNDCFSVAQLVLSVHDLFC
jgi:hypothetical protein